MRRHKLGFRSIFLRLIAVMLVMSVVVIVLLMIFFSFIVSNPDKAVAAHNALLVVMLCLLVVIFFVAHHFIKELLDPIKLLKDGVNQVANGNFDIHVPPRTNDELGELTKAFNSMATEVRTSLKEKDQLLQNVSHELKTPLTRLKLALEMQEDSPLKKGMNEDIQELEQMVFELLESERLKKGKEALKFERTDIIDLLKSAFNTYKDRKPGIVLSGLPKEFLLNIDTRQVEIAIRNIIENAIKYSKPDSLPIQVSAQQKTDTFEIRIKDNGIGIPEEERPFVFKSFYQVDRSRTKTSGGFGLGLSLCEKIMKAHGGRIRLDKNVDVDGMTAILAFPI